MPIDSAGPTPEGRSESPRRAARPRPGLILLPGGAERAGVSADTDEAQVDAWIERSLAGDHEAFGALVRAKQALVYRAAWNRLGDAEQARVVTQAVFVRLWKNLSRFDRQRRFDTWLYRLASNAAIDHHRRRAARAVQTGFDESFENLPSGGPGAERALELREVAEILHELTALLTEKQREAFLLREVEGMPTAEVAAVLRTTESTVRNHVFQARKLLREELGRRYPEYARAGSREGETS